ncbi:uncharacterized protein LOC118809395 [Colossoma macropomum]|uniref:uncharacterized protein LOC118809395 n=1 Tax=Colossoma macropomum TaxID=42526 RepID=UPI0018648CCA|nr:uncharacterized protein LOC118809395 [Colossoma macropomum]
MAGFFQQLRLLLWKNGLSVIRQPGWSLSLLIWPLVIFIILAITRSQFPPTIKDTCYVAPRNLPSAGFFPFLQTLMCNTDSSCSNKSYADRTIRAYSTSKSHRHRRDTDTQSSSKLQDGLPPLAHLQKGGLVHALLKRDTSNQSQILEMWDKMLNSSTQGTSNMTTSILDILNNTLQADQDTLTSILESLRSLKISFCGFSMSVLNLSRTDQMTAALVRFCGSNDSLLEVSFSTLNQLLAQLVLEDPVKVIESVEMAVIAVGQLQKQNPLWDFLLGLPDLFVKASDQDRIMAVAERLLGLKGALTSIQSSFPQANISLDMLNPAIDEGIDILNYFRNWKGRNATFSLADVLMPLNQSLISPEISTLIQHLQIPLDKVTVLFNNEAFYAFLCSTTVGGPSCNRSKADMVYAWISQEKVALQMMLAWSQSAASSDLALVKNILGSLLGAIPSTGSSSSSRSQRSSDSQPQNLQEQIFLSVGNVVIDTLKGMPGWNYINLFLMGAHSSMQTVTAAMETQIVYMDPVLQDAGKLQAMFQSLMQNETEADAWVRRVMESAVQTVTEALMGHMDCPRLAAPWAWISAYSSMDPELWAAIICPGNGSHLEDVLLAPLSPLVQQVNQLIHVANNTLMYDITPSMILSAWHSLYRTSMKYGTSIQALIGELELEDFSEWIEYNITVNWPEILITRGMETFEVLGSRLQKSSQWSSMEPYFHMAYWILTFQPNVTAPPNCTFTSNGIVCQTGFTWEKFIPLVESLLREVSTNPAALLRPIQGAEVLLQSIYRDTYMGMLKEFLSSSGQLFSGWSPQNILLSLAALVDTNIQLLSNITSINHLDDKVLIAMLNNIVEAFGLGELEVLWSSSSQNTSLNTVVMNIIQLFRPESIQMLYSEGKFAVLEAILRVLGEVLPAEQQIQFKQFLNRTHALFGDLAVCSATGQDCLAEVPKVFETLSFLSEVIAVGTSINVTITPIKGNMTLSVTGHILNFILPWNTSMDTVTKVIKLLEVLSASPNINIIDIQHALQTLNLTISDLEKIVQLSTSSSISLLLNKLMDTINSLQCLNLLTQNVTSIRPPGSSEAECTLKLFERALEFLQVMPFPEGSQAIISASFNAIYDQVMKLKNMFSLGSGPVIMSENIVRAVLANIRQNLLHLNVGNGTLITNDLNLLEELLNATLHERYPYFMINSTFLSQHLSAQKVYGEIALWYLHKLENATSESMFKEYLYQFIHLTEVQVKISAAQSNFSTLVSNQIQYLIDHVHPPLDGADLKMISNAVITILQGQLQLIKMNLEFQQTFFDFMGMQSNKTLPSDIEAQLMNYFNLTLGWIKNPQLTVIIAKIYGWSSGSGQVLGNKLPQKLLFSLISVVDKLLFNVNYTDQFNSQLLLTILSDILEAFGLGQLEILWSDNSQNTNLSAVVVNILQLLKPESIQALNNQSQFALLDAILRLIGEVLPSEQRSQLDRFLNHTHALISDLAICSAHEMQVLINAAQSNFSILVSGEIQDLMSHVQPPLDEADLNRISKAVMTLLQAQLQLIKMNLEIQQAFYDSMGFHMNMSIPADIEVEIMRYLNLTQSWITNPQLTLAFAKILQWNSSYVDITKPGMDLEQLIKAMAPLLSPEERVYLGVIEQVTQALNRALQLANTDGGLQSRNFTEAIMDSVRVVLRSTFNGSLPLPESAIDDITTVLQISLQLLLNNDTSYAQSQEFIVQAALRAKDFIITLVPESAEVFGPMINSIISYINIISKPSGSDTWNVV